MSKLTKTDLRKIIKQELNEWKKVNPGPKRWSKDMDGSTGLTEFEQQQVNEGPAYEYAGYMKKIEKAENVQAKQVNNLVKLLQKKGLKKEAKNLAYEYMSGMRKFNAFLRKLEGSLV